MDRSDVTFTSGGETIAAWLYRPAGEGRHPVVVMGHGFSAVREQKLDETAARFQAAGLGVLLFDYRYFGASGGEPRQLLDIPSELADWRAAVGHARGIEWADPDRIAVFGSSFSGGHVMEIAAGDARIAAAVSQCPFTDGPATLLALLRNDPKSATLLTLHGLVDQVGALVHFKPHYIPAVAPPGSLAMMNTADSEPGFAAINPPQSTWENRVAARIALKIGPYRPGRKAAGITCPILVHVCDTDSLAPAETTAKLAARAPKGEVTRYPIGHFDIYVGEDYERAVSAQTEFLTRHLLAGRKNGALSGAAGRAAVADAVMPVDR